MSSFKKAPPYRGARCFVCINLEWWNLLLPGVEAIMFRGCLYFRDEKAFNDLDLKRHEYRHYLQWRKLWFFHLRYVVANLRYGCEHNPFELEALRPFRFVS